MNIYFNLTGQLCPILPSIPNGIITYGPDDIPDFDIGTVATYQCNTGFFLLGDMTRVCTCVEAGDSRGEFSGLEPSCPERKNPVKVHLVIQVTLCDYYI